MVCGGAGLWISRCKPRGKREACIAVGAKIGVLDAVIAWDCSPGIGDCVEEDQQCGWEECRPHY